MLDLNEVAVFVEVVRATSFVGAGRRLGVPASTISRQVAGLEARLGSRLLQRSTRKLSLTVAGQAFYDRCAGAVSELAQAQQAMINSSQVPAGLIRVAAPAGFFDAFAIDWISEFLELYPQVRLQFVLNDAKADLIAENIDVAFRGGNMFDPKPAARRMLLQKFILVASPAYLARRGAPTKVHELATHDCVILGTEPGPLTWRLDGVPEVVVSGRFAANQARAVLHAALAGLGIALLPEAVAAAELYAGTLQRVLPRLSRGAGDLYAVFPSRQQIPLAVSAFVDHALKHFQVLSAQHRSQGQAH
ncbi:LysR family transcriptional regulator [Paraburkholderia pallida]|uniref:LysR family transcriptional regulator n=1 Tax=Paraburkholderia pallida TaxID=2547399 RepID=A0A4P7D2R2_9BURK|nr:LysR family transcriptional regulator [Paraburkholderia pallida]QBR01497.1 LysR family transcriptional regulator [Paraburkholderia pallida]